MFVTHPVGQPPSAIGRFPPTFEGSSHDWRQGTSVLPNFAFECTHALTHHPAGQNPSAADRLPLATFVRHDSLSSQCSNASTHSMQPLPSNLSRKVVHQRSTGQVWQGSVLQGPQESAMRTSCFPGQNVPQSYINDEALRQKRATRE